jgi:hypothetical protein
MLKCLFFIMSWNMGTVSCRCPWQSRTLEWIIEGWGVLRQTRCGTTCYLWCLYTCYCLCIVCIKGSWIMIPVTGPLFPWKVWLKFNAIWRRCMGIMSVILGRWLDEDSHQILHSRRFIPQTRKCCSSDSNLLS